MYQQKGFGFDKLKCNWQQKVFYGYKSFLFSEAKICVQQRYVREQGFLICFFAYSGSEKSFVYSGKQTF